MYALTFSLGELKLHIVGNLFMKNDYLQQEAMCATNYVMVYFSNFLGLTYK